VNDPRSGKRNEVAGAGSRRAAGEREDAREKRAAREPEEPGGPEEIDGPPRSAGGADPEPFTGGVGSLPRGVEAFGPYLVYECLGQGGMATVHRAEKRGVGIRRPIALKRLLPHVAADPQLVKLFIDEARLASHLHHANVAQTYELGKVGDTFFIAMEFAAGPTLTQIARQCQSAGIRIPVPIVVNIVSQVCDALDHAHNLCDESGRPLHLIHRDVSPANLIVTNTGVVKLIDFGIAKATTSRVKTQTGFIKGKFGYIAPEYIAGNLDARVDLFALGVIAHEMLAGRRLFEGKDDFETMSNLREMVVQPPSRWNAQVSPDLDDIVMTALARDPEHRWRSAGAMQVALTNVAHGLGVVVGNQQLVDWVEWVFSEPADSGAWADPTGGDTSLFAHAQRRADSVSVELRLSHDPVDVVTRAEPVRRARPSSDSARTVPVEYVKPPLSDFEMMTPPAIAPAPLAPPPGTPRSSSQLDAVAPRPGTPRSSSQLDAVAPRRSSRFETVQPRPGTPTLEDVAPIPAASETFEARPPPPPAPRRTSQSMASARPPHGEGPPPAAFSKTLEGVPPPPLASRASAAHDAALVPRREVSVIVVPPERMFHEPTPPPAEPEPAVSAAPSRRRTLWIALALFALGASAAAAAYYVPDLLGP
jgi:serine/threonine protein kinase